jgi:hypothetical protein
MKNFVSTRALRVTRELFGHLDHLGEFLLHRSPVFSSMLIQTVRQRRR